MLRAATHDIAVTVAVRGCRLLRPFTFASATPTTLTLDAENKQMEKAKDHTEYDSTPLIKNVMSDRFGCDIVSVCLLNAIWTFKPQWLIPVLVGMMQHSTTIDMNCDKV